MDSRVSFQVMGMTEEQMAAWAIAQSQQEHEELLTQYEDGLVQDFSILRAYLGEGYLGGLLRRMLFRRIV